MTATLVVAICLLSTFTLSTPVRPDRVFDPAAASSALTPDAGGPVGDALPVDGAATGVAGVGDPGAPAATAGTVQSASGGVRSGTKVYDCAKGQNAGATEIGVTAKQIRFAATIVKTGIAKDFLADAQLGMEAVRQKVNRAGGICGRTLAIDYKDDGWDPTTGQRIIESFIGEKKYFGLAVNPSSEGLRGPIDSGLIKANKFPVIGADGQLVNQYRDPWVWPVATSTASTMHVMAHDAVQRGAKKVGIVWEQNYRFGVEGHAAFVKAVERAGGTVVADIALQGGQTDYGNQVNDFISKCGGQDKLDQCEFIAMLLEPTTASQWVRNGGLGNGTVRPKIGIGAPQPLFIDSFARDCGAQCAGMWVWTSFKPPIDPFDTEPAVSTYRADLAAVSATADANNPHVQGAYLGMLLLVDALKKLGPAPTREGIKAVLDATKLDAGIAPALDFKPGNHFSATSVQAFKAVVNNGSFTSWRFTGRGFIADPDVGKDV
ncbi:MAG TPA: ABC transporter substrate-binding protein [Acidimicrobiales bacterium]|nr:ABC transporter substrate-binding protein [Acidimicrobiales bacterium]